MRIIPGLFRTDKNSRFIADMRRGSKHQEEVRIRQSESARVKLIRATQPVTIRIASFNDCAAKSAVESTLHWQAALSALRSFKSKRHSTFWIQYAKFWIFILTCFCIRSIPGTFPFLDQIHDIVKNYMKNRGWNMKTGSWWMAVKREKRVISRKGVKRGHWEAMWEWRPLVGRVEKSFRAL